MKIDLPRAQRPVLMLDIDGTLALLGRGDSEPTFEAVVDGFPVRVALAAPGRLQKLVEAFHVVWATSWPPESAEEFGALLGLPADLPFLRFDSDRIQGHGNFKLAVVRGFVRYRPAAWVDDELGEDCLAWAASRDQPTVLIHADPRFGLTDDHVDQLLVFARKCQVGLSEEGNPYE